MATSPASGPGGGGSFDGGTVTGDILVQEPDASSGLGVESTATGHAAALLMDDFDGGTIGLATQGVSLFSLFSHDGVTPGFLAIRSLGGPTTDKATFQILNPAGLSIFEVRADNTVHIKTGQLVTPDL